MPQLANEEQEQELLLCARRLPEQLGEKATPLRSGTRTTGRHDPAEAGIDIGQSQGRLNRSLARRFPKRA